MSVKNRRAHKLARMDNKKQRRRAQKDAQKAAQNGQRFAAPRHHRLPDSSTTLGL